ncbi:c-type cytochrome [Bordetella sp. N]|uniref:c-type cytochrome n=1 Tax=Bordetella sp. N TaxID=1746199 RepID=UPI0012E36B37
MDAGAQSPQSAARAAPASAISPAGAAGSSLSPQPAASPAAPTVSGNTLEPGTMQARLAACTACHGEQGRAGADGYYPRLAGKPQDYLYHQLLNFRDGRRQYQPMAHLLRDLPDAYLRDIAAWFADQHPPYPAPATSSADAAQMARGSQLVHQGDKTRGLPACSACHGAALSGVLPAIPGLLGLPRDYIGAQIGSWQSGLRHAAAPDCMADIARRLQPEDVAAVAAWLSAQPVPQRTATSSGNGPVVSMPAPSNATVVGSAAAPINAAVTGSAPVADYTPAPAGSLTLPVQCGSQEGAR